MGEQSQGFIDGSLSSRAICHPEPSRGTTNPSKRRDSGISITARRGPAVAGGDAKGNKIARRTSPRGRDKRQSRYRVLLRTRDCTPGGCAGAAGRGATTSGTHCVIEDYWRYLFGQRRAAR